MKHYFEVTYPRRLEDLRIQLDIIVTVVMEMPRENIVELWEQITLFSKAINLFLENTKLHLTSKKDKMINADQIYIKFLTSQYIYKYLLSKRSIHAAFLYGKAYGLEKKKGEG